MGRFRLTYQSHLQISMSPQLLVFLGLISSSYCFVLQNRQADEAPEEDYIPVRPAGGDGGWAGGYGGGGYGAGGYGAGGYGAGVALAGPIVQTGTYGANPPRYGG